MKRTLNLSILALLFSGSLSAGCGDEENSGPPVPSREERLETAEKIDASLGFDAFKIGTPLNKVVNVGKPDSYVYVDDGVRLAAYHKTSTKVKVGGTFFQKVSLYFGKSSEMQMYRMSRSLTEDIEADRKAQREKAASNDETVDEAARLAELTESHEANCQSAYGKFEEVWGRGTPRGPGKFIWVGNKVQATWEYNPVRGIPTCLIEVRAVHPR